MKRSGGSDYAQESAVPEAVLLLIALDAGSAAFLWGDRLPKLPLFLTEDEYVNVPLEASYQSAWNAVPKRWRDVFEAGSGKGT